MTFSTRKNSTGNHFQFTSQKIHLGARQKTVYSNSLVTLLFSKVQIINISQNH
jgi:hypothetical protein